MTEKAVAKPTTTAVEIPPTVADMMVDLRKMAAENTSENAEQVSLDIMERILTGESLEAGAGGTTDILELWGVPLTVMEVKWQPSTIGELGVFAVISAKDDTGREHVVTHGGRNVVTILYRAQKEGRFPLRMQFRDVPTARGFTTVWLDVLPS